jgi:hypothetical protein
MSKERRKGNPLTPTTLSLYTIHLSHSNHSSCSDVPSKSHPIIIHTTAITPDQHNHATSREVAPPQLRSFWYQISPPKSHHIPRASQCLRPYITQFLPHCPRFPITIPKYLCISLSCTMGFQLWGALEPPSVIQIIHFLSISGAPNTRIAKEFSIFGESTILINLLSIAQENCYQHLDSPGTDPAQYIMNHSGIERLSKRYQVDVSYYKTWLAYSRLTWRIQLSISLLRNKVQAHLRSTLLLRVMVSDLTQHTYSTANFDRQALILLIWSHSRHSSEPCIATLPYFGICGCQLTKCHMSDT